MIIRVELPESTLLLRCRSRDEARQWVSGLHGALPAASARLHVVPHEEALRLGCLGSAIQTINSSPPLAPVARNADRPLVDRERLYAALGR